MACSAQINPLGKILLPTFTKFEQLKQSLDFLRGRRPAESSTCQPNQDFACVLNATNCRGNRAK